jgi:hypothetical protein
MVPDYGAGESSCGTWLTDRRANNWFDDLEWVLGWVSAAGYCHVQQGPGALRLTDRDAITAWLDKYCREHPLN